MDDMAKECFAVQYSSYHILDMGLVDSIISLRGEGSTCSNLLSCVTVFTPLQRYVKHPFLPRFTK
jgi:hypothetical protein